MKNLPNILKEAKATRERLDYEARLINHPAQDMADPKNWREGDVVECLVGTGFYYTAGRKYRLIKWSDKGNVVDSNGDVTMVDDEGDQWQARADKFRWISR